MKTLCLAAALVAAAAPAARADQCMLVPADTAAAAVKVVKALDLSVALYCEPCHESPPRALPKVKPKTVVAVADKTDKTKARVQVDGAPVDLAYLYVATSKTVLTNVGLMVGCGATGVTGFVPVGTATMAPGAPAVPTDDAKLAAARAKVTALRAQLVDLERQITASVNAVAAAKTDTDRHAASTKLHELQKQKTDLDAQLAAANSEAARLEREHGKQGAVQCLDNPLAKGC